MMESLRKARRLSGIPADKMWYTWHTEADRQIWRTATGCCLSPAHRTSRKEERSQIPHDMHCHTDSVTVLQDLAASRPNSDYRLFRDSRNQRVLQCFTFDELGSPLHVETHHHWLTLITPAAHCLLDCLRELSHCCGHGLSRAVVRDGTAVGEDRKV